MARAGGRPSSEPGGQTDQNIRITSEDTPTITLSIPKPTPATTHFSVRRSDLRTATSSATSLTRRSNLITASFVAANSSFVAVNSSFVGALGHVVPRGEVGNILLGDEMGVKQRELLVSERFRLTGRHALVGEALDEPMRIEGYGVRTSHAAIVFAAQPERKPRTSGVRLRRCRHWARSSRDSPHQYVARPPLRSNTAPVVNEFSSDTIHATIAAASPTARNRPRGIFESM